MSVNQDNVSIERKIQISEIPKEHGFLDEKVRTRKRSINAKSNYIGKITYNIN